jgi:predicted DNA binding CopG/RHH family protein
MKPAPRARPVQLFSREYLERCKKMSPTEIAEYLEGFRLLHEPASPSRLISLKVPQALLDAFRRKCQMEGTRYQTQIKRLMAEWLD